jgi:hypothetical protein
MPIHGLQVSQVLASTVDASTGLGDRDPLAGDFTHGKHDLVENAVAHHISPD